MKNDDHLHHFLNAEEIGEFDYRYENLLKNPKSQSEFARYKKNMDEMDAISRPLSEKLGIKHCERTFEDWAHTTVFAEMSMRRNTARYAFETKGMTPEQIKEHDIQGAVAFIVDESFGGR